MASSGPTEMANAVTSSTKPKKKNKKKSSKSKSNGEPAKLNGIKTEEEKDDNDADEDEQGTPTFSEPQTPIRPDADETTRVANNENAAENGPLEDSSKNGVLEQGNGTQRPKSQSKRNSLVTQPVIPDQTEAFPTAESSRFDALAKEREALRKEVAQMRKSLEELQERHEDEMSGVREQLTVTEEGKQQAETQYQSLLGKVNTIRSQLGERLKADAEDLKESRGIIKDLEEQNASLREESEARAAELTAVAEDSEQRSKELSGLRNRTTLSQQNWAKEREDLLQREADASEMLEDAKQAMSDWKVLAMEERSVRENITEKVADLEEQIASHREAHERACAERDSQSATVDGLQRALHEIQDARRKELREIVENSQSQVENLQKQLREAETRATESLTTLNSTKEELQRALPFEREVKEKNLLIGKQRHEAVILNEHLTKALRYLKYLKKGKPQDTIDKQLITNHFMHFLGLDRTDPKKFQILQIIASLLEWSDEQREQAGLARPGASNPNTKIPVSPWHRTPSTPQLSTEFFPSGGTKKESLAELWSGFLEQEAQENPRGNQSPPSSSSGSKPP